MDNFRIIFIDVDSRERFGSPEGYAWCKHGELIRSNAERLLALAEARSLPVVVTCCCNAAYVPVAGPLPEDMVELAPEEQRNVSALVKTHRVFLLGKIPRKPGDDPYCAVRTYDNNVNAVPLFDALAPDECIVFGRSAHYCTPYTVRWLFSRGLRVTVISDAITTREGSVADALPYLRQLAQEGARIETTDECLARISV